MEIRQCCNNKCVIVYHKGKSYLFSYGTLILSRDQKNRLWRHFNNRELLSLTTIRHVHEFGWVSPKNKNVRDQIMAINYKGE